MFALAILFLSASLLAGSAPWFPRKTGECGWVHGRFAVYNGSGIRRIWVIGTDHMLNLWDDDKNVPLELEVGFDKWLYGDFDVCATEPFKSGHMQHVRVRRVRNIVSKPTGDGQ